MATNQQSPVAAVFADRSQAEAAVAALRQAGFRDEQIGVAARDPHAEAAEKAAGGPDRAFARPTVGTGAGMGMLVGGALGGLAVTGAAIGAAPALLGLLGGALVGSLLGGLIDLGVPEEEARFYHGAVEEGQTLVTVHAEGREGQALDILREHGGEARASAS